MPGNDLGDRVHNFFAQDNSLQGQHHSPVQEGNWPVLNSNFWVGSQGLVDQLSSNSKIYDSQNSDVDRGETGYAQLARHLGNGLNLTQSNLRPEQPNLNGLLYANQFLQARQNEASFLGMDTGSDNLNLITSRGLLAPDVLQGAGAGHQTKPSDRSEASVSPVILDLFGGQQHMNHGQQHMNHGQQQMNQEQSNATQSLPHQQQLQQQLMMKKLQEFQLQQQHNRQLDLRQQYLGSQLPSFAKQNSSVHSTLVNGTTKSDTSLYPRPAAVGTSWLNQGSSSMHGSPNGLGFPPNVGQTQLDLAPQQVDKSLYGVPISSSRGLNMDHYSQMVTSKASIPQMPISSNFLQGNQPNLFPEQVGVQGESTVSRHKVLNDGMFGYSSKQSQFLELGNMGSLHQANSMSGNQPQKQSSQEKISKRVALPQNEVGLDPTEEKILFGSDDNIWAAFGKESNVTGESGNIFDNDGSNVLPNIQSGSWSALMQSAVAETSSNDSVLQEEWSGLSSQKNNSTSWSRSPSFPHSGFKQEKPLFEGSKRMPSALNSGSFPPSDNISNNATTSQKFQNETDQRLQTEASQIFFQSLGEANKSSNCGPLQNSVAEGSRYRDASQPSIWDERNAKTTEFPGTSRQSNGWNALKAVPTEGHMNSDDAENLQQNSKNRQVGVTQGKVSHGRSFWKPNSIPISSMELDNVKSRASNPQANHGLLSLKDTTSVDNSRSVQNNETSSQFQNSYSFNQWTNVHPSSISQGGESLGMLLNRANDPNQVSESMSGREKDESARFELEGHNIKENSNDSHHSNLSQPSVRGLREGGVLDTTDSWPVTAGMQNLPSQLSRKVSGPRKFQYHPMGNVDEDVDPAYGLKQPSHVQTMHPKNAHFGQSKIFGQVKQNSTLIGKGQSSELQRDIRGPYEKPSSGDLSGHVHNRPAPHNHHAETLSSASSSSQNMLELFNKVDHSRNHGAMVQLNSSVPPSHLAVVEKHDEFGHLRRNQSHVSQGFGLQLGPPSQQMQISNRQLSSQNDQGAFNLLCSDNTASEKGDKSPRMVAQNSVQPLPSSEETHPESKLNISRIPGHGGNENFLYKAPRNFTSFSSGIPYSRHDQNQQIAGVSGQMPLNQRINSLCQKAFHTQRTAEAISLDAYGGFQRDNHFSLGAMSEQSGPNDVQEQGATATMATRDSQRNSHHFPLSGPAQQGNSLHMLQNMGSNIPLLRQNSGFEIQQTSSQTLELPQRNIVESSDPLMQDHVNSQGFDGEEQKLVGSAGQQVASESTEAVPEVTPFLKNHLDVSPSSSASMRKDIEAFGRSLKPNSCSHQNSTLLNQIQVLKDAETDSCNRVSKRMKGMENVVDVHLVASKPGQHLVHNDMLGDPLGSSRHTGLLERNPSQDGNVASRDDLGLSQDISQNDSCIDLMTSPRVDNQVNPQMTPSLFGQYDAPRITPSKPGEQSLIPHGKCSSGSHTASSEENRATSPADACQNSNNHQNLTISSVPSRGVSSLNPLQLNATGQNLAILRSKKRKSAILDLYPWHKEISEVSHDHVAQSMTESDGDIASNCLIDKVDGVADLAEDGSLVLRYKRRLILTTCLIQKLLRYAPAAILSADATTRHDALVYAVSRITLGDACSTVYHLRSLDVPCDDMDVPPSGQLSVRNGVQSYAKAAEELRGRIRKLKNDFSRVYKSAPILDLRIECQDLDKVFVINRFARFHGRASSDNAEPASSSGSATGHKPIPQRYVTALPFPKNIPDEVQCLSL